MNRSYVDSGPELSVLDDIYKDDRCVVTLKSVVPWYNPEQFQKVYQYLYSPNIMMKRWAVDQIDVWESRCHPSLPTAIEASQTITKAIIQDILYTNQANICQEKEIQLMYSMALVRFVNLSVELHQSYAKQPLADVAERLGIPAWIIDLRNESAHSYMPSLPVLRMGAEEAMKFLEDSYWSVECMKLKNIIKEPVNIEAVKAVIAAFQYTQFSLIKLRDTESELYKLLYGNMTNILKKMKQCIVKNRKEFIDAMCMDGAFITGPNELNALMNLKCKDWDSSKQSKLDQQLWADVLEKKPDIPPALPRIVEKFWYPVLVIANKHGVIPELVEALLYTQGDRNPEEQVLLAAWITKILRFPLMSVEKQKGTPLIKEFRVRAPVFNWNRLLGAAIANPCIYTPYFFPLINAHLELEQEFITQVMCLMAIYIKEGKNIMINPKVIPKEHSAFTVEDVKKVRKRQEKKIRLDKKKKEVKNIWSLAPDTIEWQNIPIGHVFTEDEGNGNSSDDDWMNIDTTDFVEKYLNNKNDSEDMEGFDTVEQDTFNEDGLIISARKNFLIKSKSDS